jgi:anti-sigma-K factor RskA
VTRCDDPAVGEQLGSYMLGSCAQAEAVAVERHLRVCPACAREAEHLRRARDALLDAVPEVPPPPALKARVMEAVRADAQLFAAARAPVEAVVSARPATTRRHRLLAWCRAPVPAWALACCVLVLVGFGLAATARRHASATVREVVARVDPRQAPAGRARVTLADAHRAHLTVEGLPPPGRGRLYQVWLVSGTGGPRPTRVKFNVASGRASVALPPRAADADELLVTSEPRGGSQAPSRPPVLSAPV